MVMAELAQTGVDPNITDVVIVEEGRPYRLWYDHVSGRAQRFAVGGESEEAGKVEETADRESSQAFKPFGAEIARVFAEVVKQREVSPDYLLSFPDFTQVQRVYLASMTIEGAQTQSLNCMLELSDSSPTYNLTAYQTGAKGGGAFAVKEMADSLKSLLWRMVRENLLAAGWRVVRPDPECRIETWRSPGQESRIERLALIEVISELLESRFDADRVSSNESALFSQAQLRLPNGQRFEFRVTEL